MTKGKSSVFYKSTHVVVGNSAKDLVSFGYSQGWDFPVLGSAPIPTRPIHINDWLITPAHLDSTDLPLRAKQRLDAIFSAGIRPIGLLLIHEAPKQLPTGEIRKKSDSRNEVVTPKARIQAKKVLQASGSVLGAIAIETGAITLAIAAAALILPGFLIAGALLLDPILVVVTEDGFWVEIDRWDI